MNTTAIQPADNNLPKASRVAVTLQRAPSALAVNLPTDIDAALAFLPDVASLDADDCPPVRYDNRAWLTPPEAEIVMAPSGVSTLSFGPAPDGLTRLERVLWPQLGVACARASLWLHSWMKTRRYRKACELSGVEGFEITLFRDASHIFRACFDAVQAAVRDNRHAQTEDTMYDLANGEIRKEKTVTDAEGNVTTTDEGPIYDPKMVQLALAAGDPTRYGGGRPGAGSGGPAVVINIQAPRPEDYAVRVAVRPSDQPASEPASEPDAVDAEVIEG